MGLLIRWLVNAVALLIVAYVVPGVHVSAFGGALIAALVLGIANAVVKPILVIISLPLELITLGLFTFVINAVIFWVVGNLGMGLYVSSFGAAFIGALLLTVVSFLLSQLVQPVPKRA